LGLRSLTQRGSLDIARQLAVLRLLELRLNAIRVSGYIFELIVLICSIAFLFMLYRELFLELVSNTKCFVMQIQINSDDHKCLINYLVSGLILMIGCTDSKLR